MVGCLWFNNNDTDNNNNNNNNNITEDVDTCKGT